MFYFFIFILFFFSSNLHANRESFSGIFRDVARESLSAVVLIKTLVLEENQDMTIAGDNKVETYRKGTGFLISDDGYILTNTHLVKNAQNIFVVYAGVEELASLVRFDERSDVAILRMEGEGFSYLRLGDSDKTEIGDWVATAGYPFLIDPFLTQGIISGKNFIILQGNLRNFLFTDALIHPGNSGGPLLNLQSEVIGINTAAFLPKGAFVGYGIAIPINVAKDFISKVIDSSR